MGNRLRHCVRLGILHEIEPEFSKIGVRMTKLWLPKVSEIFRVQNSSNSSSNSNFKTQTDWAGNFPLSTPGQLGSRLGSRHPQTRSTGQSTWVQNPLLGLGAF